MTEIKPTIQEIAAMPFPARNTHTAAQPQREAVLEEALTKISDMGDAEIYANPAAVKRLVRDALSTGE